MKEKKIIGITNIEFQVALKHKKCTKLLVKWQGVTLYLLLKLLDLFIFYTIFKKKLIKYIN